MATLAQNYQQDDKDKQGQFSSSAAPTIGSGQGAGTFASQNATQGGNAPASNAGSSSGRFSNITNYLQANKPQQSLGQKIAGNIQGQGQKVQGNLQNQQQQFGKESEANRNVFNQGLVGGALNDAAKFVQDPNQLSAFEKQRTGQYGGPQALSDEAALNAQASNVQRQGQATGTEAGQFGLLRQMFGRPSYSQGQQKLDQLFVQSGPKNQFSQAKREANQAAQQVGQGEQQAGLLGKTYGTEAQETNKRTTEALTGKTQEEYKTLDQRVAEEQAKKQALVAGLQGQLGKNQLTQDFASKYGVTPGQLYGLNLGSYLTVDPTEANRATVAGAEDYAKFNALNKLAGQQGPATEFADQSQAGRFLQNQTGFDTDRFNQQRAANKATFEAENQRLAQEHARARKRVENVDVEDANNPAERWKRAEWLDPSYARGESLNNEDKFLVEQYRAAKQAEADIQANLQKYGGSASIV